MSSIFRQWKNRLQDSNKQINHQNHSLIDNELKNVYNTLDKLFNENSTLKIRLDKLEEKYQQWINNEQNYFLKRIEKLENDNYQSRKIYQTYQIQNEKCIRTIIDLIIKILLTQQELRRQNIERHNTNDTNQWRKRQQQNDNRYTTNDQSMCTHQRLMIIEEQDQKINDLSELNNHSSTLATVKPKSDKSSTGSTNKLYFVLNNENLPRNNRHLPDTTNVSLGNSNISYRKQQLSTSPMTFNKNQITQQQQQTRTTTLSNHERIPTKTSYRTSPIINKTTPPKTITSVSKPPRIPTITVRPLVSNIRQQSPIISTTNQKTISSSPTINKSIRARYTLPKSPSPLRSVNSIRTHSPKIQPMANKLINSNTKPPPTTTTNNRTRIPIINQQSARVSDLDTLISNKTKLSDKSSIITSPLIVNNIQHSLFSKDTVKLVRPVRSQELKLFSCHLTSDISSSTENKITFQTNESFSTLTPSSLESINDKKSINNQLIEKITDDIDLSSNIPNVIRDFSEDSLNEHYHIQKLLKKQNVLNNTTKNGNIQGHSSTDSIQTSSESKITSLKSQVSIDLIYDKQENIPEGYFLNNNKNNLNHHYNQSLIHRLVFPQRLGRMVFYRRTLSDSDIYQKICSKDNEIYHNVYHLDTIRDYSMEYYMLTTYGSDSQLYAWIDSDDDEIVNSVCHLDENRFETNENQIKSINSSDSLIQEEELDWYSELELFNISLNDQQEKFENTSSYSSEAHAEELLPTEKLSISSPTTTTSIDSSISSDVTSASWATPNSTSNYLHSSPPIFSNLINQNNSQSDHFITSNNNEQDINLDPYENSLTSSIINDEFQTDFYYLCPITNTTNFSKTDV